MMSPTTTTVRIVLLLQQNRRITVRKLAKELGLTMRSARRWVARIATELPVRLENGVVILDD